MSLSEETIAALFAENRRFDPPADIAANAVPVSYTHLRQHSPDFEGLTYEVERRLSWPSIGRAFRSAVRKIR